MRTKPQAFRLRWKRPKLTIYRAADRGFGFRLNRYPGVVIGAALLVGFTVVSFTWGRPGAAAGGGDRG